MSKTLALVWLTVLWVVYFLLTGILSLPYGMGEPGGPKDLEGFFRVERPRALFTVVGAAIGGGIVGFVLIFNTFYVAGPVFSAGITSAGCWMARLHLRRADVDHRV